MLEVVVASLRENTALGKCGKGPAGMDGAQIIRSASTCHAHVGDPHPEWTAMEFASRALINWQESGEGAPGTRVLVHLAHTAYVASCAAATPERAAIVNKLSRSIVQTIAPESLDLGTGLIEAASTSSSICLEWAELAIDWSNVAIGSDEDVGIPDDLVVAALNAASSLIINSPQNGDADGDDAFRSRLLRSLASTIPSALKKGKLAYLAALAAAFKSIADAGNRSDIALELRADDTRFVAGVSGALPMIPETQDLAVEAVRACFESGDASVREVIHRAFAQEDETPFWTSIIECIPDRRGLWLLDELCFKYSLKEGDEDEATRIMVMLAARGIARTAEREDAFRVRPLKLSACADLASNMERQALGHICAWDEGSNGEGFSDDGAPDFDIALVASFVARWCKQEPWAMLTKLESLAEFCQRIIDWPSAKWRSAALSFMTHLIGNFENISEVDRSVILSLMGSVVAVYTSKTGEHAEAEALMLVVMQHFSGNDALSIMESLNAPQQRPYSANTHLQLARSGLAVNAILGEIFFSADQRMSVLPETIAVKRASNRPRSIPPPCLLRRLPWMRMKRRVRSRKKTHLLRTLRLKVKLIKWIVQ